jgi:Flp pilus assembly protein CpaB
VSEAPEDGPLAFDRSSRAREASRLLRRSPRAALLWAAAAVVTIVTATSVAGTLASLHRQDRDYGKVRAVVVARRDHTRGAVVGAQDVATLRLRGHALPARSLGRPEDAVGRVVSVPVVRGSIVTDRNLAGRTRDGRDGVVPPGRRAMRIVTSDGLAPHPGDVVDVYVTFPTNAVPESVDPTLTVASHVPVLDVDGAGETTDTDTGERAQRVGVTLLVPAEDAKRLAFAAATGTIALAATPPEDAATTR